MGIADGGSGGDPLNNAQNLDSAFGKILRIDPLGTNSANGKYGIPERQSVRQRQRSRHARRNLRRTALRNPQRFAWDSKTGNMFVADIGQNIVEEISHGDRRARTRLEQLGRQLQLHQPAGVSLENPRGDSKMTYPDRRVRPARSAAAAQSAVTMGVVYRQKAIPQLANLLIFGDNPSGEIFYVSADNLPNGGQECDPPHPLQRQRADEDAAAS